MGCVDPGPQVPGCPCYPDRASAREGPGVKCLRCHQDNPSHAKFCLECGTSLHSGTMSPADGRNEIERLRQSLNDALEQQTATGEILRVIANSPTDLEPVMNAVAESAARLCEATDSAILRVDGEVLRMVVQRGSMTGALAVGEALPITRGSTSGRAVVDCRTVHVPDMAAESDAEFPVTKARARTRGTGLRTHLATPLFRQGVPIGVIVIRRYEVRPFTETQIKLLETFANQAVIAIE